MALNLLYGRKSAFCTQISGILTPANSLTVLQTNRPAFLIPQLTVIFCQVVAMKIFQSSCQVVGIIFPQTTCSYENLPIKLSTCSYENLSIELSSCSYDFPQIKFSLQSQRLLFKYTQNKTGFRPVSWQQQIFFSFFQLICSNLL